MIPTLPVPDSMATPPDLRLSVIVPCRNEERYIAPCLDSILRTDYPRDRLEVLVVDGCSDDRTRRIVQEYAGRYPCIRLIDNPGRVVPAALNRGIRAAGGDVIARMDAHAIYPPEYLPRLVAALIRTGADNVGGRIVTMPAHPGAVARAIAIALAHPFGVGNSWFRIGTAEARWVDTVPFGCYRRDVFARIGLFDEDLVRNQDDEFNHRLIRHGGRVLLLPDVVSSYYARESLSKLWRMYHQYGYFKPLAARKVGRVMTFRQLVPASSMVALIALALLALLWAPAAALWCGTIGIYAAAAAGCALLSAHSHGPRCVLALAIAFPVLHGSYAFGFLRGLGHLAAGRRSRPSDPAAVPLSR